MIQRSIKVRVINAKPVCDPIDWHVHANVHCHYRVAFAFLCLELKSQLFCALIPCCHGFFKLLFQVVLSFLASEAKKHKGTKKSQGVINFSQDEKGQDHQGTLLSYIL